MSSLSFAQTREAELAWVDGRLVMQGTRSDLKEEKMDTDDEYRRESVPVLEQIPPEEVFKSSRQSFLLVLIFVIVISA